MTKYIISNGRSVVSCTLEDNTQTAIEVTTREELSIKYDTIGKAMRYAAKVNEILGGANYQVMPIEVNKN